MDYRYFPEPDLPTLVIAPEEIEAVRLRLPELPEARKRRFMTQYGLTDYESAMILQDRAFADAFETVALGSGSGKQTANWMLGEVSRALNDRNTTFSGLGLDLDHLAELIGLVEAKTINLSTAKETIFPAMLRGEGSPKIIVERQGLAQVSDRDAIDALVGAVLSANAVQVAQFRAGNERLRGFLVGQVMKAGQGKMNPQVVNEALDRALTKDSRG
jgi:aspartyl-tRNA(Asn)/glutamyl-tRNA(Gln) amidotransferase subunit B